MRGGREVATSRCLCKCTDRFFARLKKDADGYKVAYGAAKFAPTGKGGQAVPTTSMAKACARFFEVTMVDEYRTSKVCSHCDQELNVICKGGKQVRGLRRCGSSVCRSSCLKNRDLNAALNIARCAKEEERPQSLMRKMHSVCATRTECSSAADTRT